MQNYIEVTETMNEYIRTVTDSLDINENATEGITDSFDKAVHDRAETAHACGKIRNLEPPSSLQQTTK